MFNTIPCPKKRGPMLDFKVRADDILESRAQSCGFCTILAKLDVDGSILSEKQEPSVVRLQAFWPSKAGGLALPVSLEVGLHSSVGGGGETWPLTFPEEQDTLPSAIFTVDGRNVLNMPALIEPVKAWLMRCEHAHPGCRSIRDPVLPTRLLDLEDFLTHDRVRLVDTQEMESSEFAVLSYVWGSANNIRLVNSSLSAFQDGIASKDLPRTIADCLHVACALDLKYVWIDSLCILQDSDGDKEHELPHMSEYYQNACLVISPSGAQDVQMGFLDLMLSDVDQGMTEQRAERLQNAGLVPFRLPVHLPDCSRSMKVNAMPLRYNYHREPLNNRAWTLQESVLPRRLLTVSQSGGLSMQCMEGETLAGNMNSAPYHELPSFASLGSISLAERTNDQLTELWRDMVQEFTRRSLSYRSDMLIAIGALAKEFHAQHCGLLGKYVAGLWSNHILIGLLWHNSSSTPSKPPHPSKYIAPSWSWVSSIYPVRYDTAPEIYLPGGNVEGPKWDQYFVTRFYCEVLTCEVTPESPLNEFGALKAGGLTFRGPLRQLHRRPAEPEREKQKTSKVGTLKAGARNIKGFLQSSLKSKKRSEKLNLVPSQRGVDRCVASLLSLLGATDGLEILILDTKPTWDMEQEIPWDDERPWYWLGLWYAGRWRGRGLVLGKQETGTFKRIGHAVFHVEVGQFPSSELHNEPIIRII